MYGIKNINTWLRRVYTTSKVYVYERLLHFCEGLLRFYLRRSTTRLWRVATTLRIMARRLQKVATLLRRVTTLIAPMKGGYVTSKDSYASIKGCYASTSGHYAAPKDRNVTTKDCYANTFVLTTLVRKMATRLRKISRNDEIDGSCLLMLTSWLS